MHEVEINENILPQKEDGSLKLCFMLNCILGLRITGFIVFVTHHRQKPLDSA
jgi:hypothetical protein